MKEITLKCIDSTNKFEKCKIFIKKIDNTTKLTFKCREIIIESENDFPFMALKEIRKKLEREKMKILCKGSLVNVYPSGMSASSFGAYKMTMGKPAEEEDFINIFSPTGDVHLIKSVVEQEVYRENWLSSF